MAFLAREVDLSTATRGSAETERIPPSWVALVEILARVDRERYRWPVGRTTFQKMAYFATEEGLPTGLEFHRASYGPFTDDLKPMLTRLVNNGLLQEDRLGSMLPLRPGITYQDTTNTYQGDLREWEPLISRVADLFLRMNTHQAEIASTVHFAAKELMRFSTEDVTELAILQAVKDWKQRRKPPLEEMEIAQAIRDLNLLGWFHAQPSNDLPLPAEDLLEI